MFTAFTKKSEIDRAPDFDNTQINTQINTQTDTDYQLKSSKARKKKESGTTQESTQRSPGSFHRIKRYLNHKDAIALEYCAI